VLHASQNTIRLLGGSTSRWHVLHLAASSVLVDFLRLTPCEGCGRVGTNTTGLFTLRPDLVRVGSGVYESETSVLSSSYGLLDTFFLLHLQPLTSSSSSSSLSERLRLPPRPPRPPRPRPRPLPEPRPEDAPAGDAPTSAFTVVGVLMRPPLPLRTLLVIGGGVGSLSLVT
jgi:hypothetical protein